MIFVKRNAAPPIFTKLNGPAQREIEKAKAIFSADPQSKKFDARFYSTYKNDYKDDLVRMFNSRCAYCECFITIGNRGDIEHFRPKSEYATSDHKKCSPGYYWLAADWKNLYLACTNCNQVTTFDILDADNPGQIVRRTAGKSIQFGLTDENFRRNRHSLQWEEEEPYRLLIDPCKDKPETLLEFTKEGIVRPRAAGGIDKQKAEYSIEVYVLQRDILVRARKQKWLVLSGKMRYIGGAIGFVMQDLRNGVNTTYSSFLQTELQEAFMELLDLLNTTKVPNEFIGLCRQFVHPFLGMYADKVSGFLLPVRARETWWQAAVSYFQPQLTGLKDYMNTLE